MTAYANMARPFGDGVPSGDVQKAARCLRKVLASAQETGSDIEISSPDGARATLTLAPEMTELLMSLLRPLSQGEAVAMVPIGQELTTQEAADILNVSRPHLIKLIDQGELPCTKVGRHRRIAFEQLLAYKQKRDLQRSGALDDLMQSDADLI